MVGCGAVELNVRIDSTDVSSYTPTFNNPACLIDCITIGAGL